MRKITISGITYKSVLEASRCLGVTSGTIYSRLAKGTQMDIPVKKDCTGDECSIDGIVFPSVNAAAKHYKVNAESVRSRLKKGMDIEAAVKTPFLQRKHRNKHKKKALELVDPFLQLNRMIASKYQSFNYKEIRR